MGKGICKQITVLHRFSVFSKLWFCFLTRFNQTYSCLTCIMCNYSFVMRMFLKEIQFPLNLPEFFYTFFATWWKLQVHNTEYQFFIHIKEAFSDFEVVWIWQCAVDRVWFESQILQGNNRKGKPVAKGGPGAEPPWKFSPPGRLKNTIAFMHFNVWAQMKIFRCTLRSFFVPPVPCLAMGMSKGTETRAFQPPLRRCNWAEIWYHLVYRKRRQRWRRRLPQQSPHCEPWPRQSLAHSERQSPYYISSVWYHLI